jgi:hypothetical protein
MPWNKDDLRRTEEHIEQALRYIAMQEVRVQEMQREGRDTSDAEELLESLRQTLAVLRRHKSTIERGLE